MIARAWSVEWYDGAGMAGKILIVDDMAVNRIVLRVKLGRAHYATTAAADGAAALASLAAERPALVLLDIDLPDMSGLDVLAAIRRDRALGDLPVLILTADTQRATRLAALAAGADDILTKPVDEDLLLARIRSLLRRDAGQSAAAGSPLWDMADPPAPFHHPAASDHPARTERPGLVAVVTHRADLRLRLSRDLAQRTGHSVTPLTRDEVLAQTADTGPLPEAFVIDADTGTGLHFVSELRSRPASSQCGVLLLCDGAKQAATAFDMGVDEVAPSDADPQEIALRLSAVLRRTRDAESRRLSLHEGLRLAVTDPLTGLHNLRHAERELGLIAEHARRTQHPFALLFIDLDRFKQVNDRHGHAAGDHVLIAVAAALSAALRPGDMLARIGGEEFLLALPGLDLDHARAVAERLCDRVRALEITLAQGAAIHVTVSIGLAIGTGAEPVDGLRDRADRALLVAKSKGRNRVATDRHAA